MYELISKEDIINIDAATIEVLEKTGVLVENDDILDLLENSGVKIDRKKRIARLNESLVRKCLEKAPSSFDIYSRKG